MEAREKVKRTHSKLSSIQWDFVKRTTSYNQEDSGTSTASRDDRSPQRELTYDIMPTNDVVSREFEEFIEASSPQEEEENALRLKTIEEKWQLIFQTEKKEPFETPANYLEQLKKHTASGSRRPHGSMKKSSEGPSPLSYWLRKLKLDIKTFNTGTFVSDLCKKPLLGLTVLMDVLKQIHNDQEKLQSVRKSKADQLKHVQLDEYDCLLCMKFAIKNKECVPLLLSCGGAVEMIALCLPNTFRKTTITVIEILTLLCETPQGYLQVMDAITQLRVKSMESVRFRLIANMLHSQDTNRHFQAVCVRFFNKLLSCTDNANARVHLQHELEQAGFEPDVLDRYALTDTPDFDELQKELDTWRKNFINVENSHQEVIDLKNRNGYLRDEIDRLQDKMKELQDQHKKMEKEKLEANNRRDKLREQSAELQDMLGRVVDLYKDRVREDPAEEIEDLNKYHKPLDMYTTIKDKYNTINSTNSRLLGSIGPGSSVPSAPPLIPTDFLSQTVRRKVETLVNLPNLSWTPIHDVRNTLFEEIDDEAKLREIDVSELNKVFQLPAKEVEARQRGDRIRQVDAHKITFVEPSRARNMIITMKSISLSPENLRKAINDLEVTKLSGESAELLMKYIPNKEELRKLAEHHLGYSRMGEAERYLHQMTKVERLERKLSLMAFIGKFEDVAEIVKMEIDVIQRSSDSLLRSLKLKKVFELILAFGNYMNSNKKGYAYGFRLDSLAKLQEVKSRTDPQQTLLHFLTQYIEDHYPELHSFGAELDLCVDKGVSYQSVATDVHGMRKGMDLLRFEREKQPDNDVLNNFFNKVSAEVAQITDSFRKMEESWKNVCGYFAENFREIEPDELVKHIQDFVAAVRKCSEENFKRMHPDQFSSIKPGQRSYSSSSLNTTLSRQQSNTGPSLTTPLSRQQSSTGSMDSLHKNLDTPSKTKPVKDKFRDNSLPKKHHFFYSQKDGGRTPPRSKEEPQHVTKIKVTADSNMPHKGSELPKVSGHPRKPQSSVITESGDIRLKDSHSFFFGAKDGSRESDYAIVKKTPSFKEPSRAQPASSGIKRTQTAPSGPKPMMVKRQAPSAPNGNIPSSEINQKYKNPSRTPSKVEPIYEDISDINDQVPTSRPLSNGYANGDSAPSTLSSLSSMSKSLDRNRLDSGSLSGYGMSDSKPSSERNRLDSGSLAGFGMSDSKPSSEVSVPPSSHYEQEYDDVLHTLNEVLNNAINDGTVASEDESTAL